MLFCPPDNAAPLDVALVFITVTNALVRFSGMNSHDPVGQCYTEPGPAWDASIFLPGGVAPPGRPPLLRVRWTLGNVRLIPEWMRRKQRFAEVEMVFQANVVYVANAILQKDMPQQAANLDIITTATG